MNLTIDSSVFIASLNVSDVNHSLSVKFFQKIAPRTRYHSIIIPATIICETLHVLNRLGDPVGSTEIFSHASPDVLVPIDKFFIQEYLLEMRRFKIMKTADAMIAAVAAKHNATLISWDRQLVKSTRPIVQSLTPAEFVKRFGM